jgi:hypothetical protein
MKILSVTLFRKLAQVLRYPPVTREVVPKAAVILKIVPKAGHVMYAGENRPMRDKESRNRNFGSNNRHN